MNFCGGIGNGTIGVIDFLSGEESGTISASQRYAVEGTAILKENFYRIGFEGKF